MRSTIRVAVVLAALLPGSLAAQGYRLRLESRVERVSYRGVAEDSIPATQAVTGANGGFFTADGFAVSCLGPFCRFFRPGPVLRAGPMTTNANLVLWGLGVTGLTVRMSARYTTDLATPNIAPATSPELQLIEGYAEYTRGLLQVMGGRQLLTSRLGLYGFDGGRVKVALDQPRLDASIYGGWGLARGSSIPVTSDNLNPLADFKPRERQIVAGADLGWRTLRSEVRAEYRREVDPRSDHFVSERVAVNGAVRPIHGLHLVAGADWDLAQHQLGTADGRVTYATRYGSVSAGGRRYRPFFDLWTIWGAFSPVAYDALNGSVTVRPVTAIEIEARGERYWYDNTGADVAATETEDSGWRWGLNARWSPHPQWTADVGAHAELGPGASSRGYDGRVSYHPRPDLALAVEGGWMERPLEFRFSESNLNWVGASVDAQPLDRVQVTLRAARYGENRARPDPAAFDFNQVRLSARVAILFQSRTERAWLPPVLGQRSR